MWTICPASLRCTTSDRPSDSSQTVSLPRRHTRSIRRPIEVLEASGPGAALNSLGLCTSTPIDRPPEQPWRRDRGRATRPRVAQARSRVEAPALESASCPPSSGPASGPRAARAVISSAPTMISTSRGAMRSQLVLGPFEQQLVVHLQQHVTVGASSRRKSATRIIAILTMSLAEPWIGALMICRIAAVAHAYRCGCASRASSAAGRAASRRSRRPRPCRSPCPGTP